MGSLIRLWHRFALSGMLLSVVLALAGCEGGGGSSHIWDDHDFGRNNPDLYVAVGDSITSGYGLESMSEAYPGKLAGMLGKTVVNHGVQGSTSFYGAEHVYSVLRVYKPGYLLILYGVNDLVQGYDIDSVIANLRTMIMAAKASQIIPVVATLTPVFDWYGDIESEVATLNAAIRLMGAEENVCVADLDRAFNWNPDYMCEDGLHPNSAGHELIAMTFYEILE